MAEPFLPRVLSKVGSGIDKALLPLVVAVIPICGVLVGVLGLWMASAGPTHIRGVETNVYFTIQKALGGQPLYTNPSDVPFEVAQYAPLYYLACQAVASILSISPGDAKAISMVARSVSLGSSLLGFTILYLLQVRTLRIPRPMAIVATAFAFASCSPWLFLARPDALMYLFMLAAIAAIMQVDANSAPRLPWLATAALLSLSALATKQNGAIVIAIVLLSLLASGRRTDFLVTGAVFGVAAAILGGLALRVWPYFLENVVDGVNNGIDLTNAVTKTYARTFNNFAFPIAVGVFIALKWAELPPAVRSLRQTVVLVAIAATLAGALASGLKSGSAEGYFNETIIFSCLAASMFLGTSTPGTPTIDARDGLLRAIACFLLVSVPFWAGKQWYDYFWRAEDIEAAGTTLANRSFDSEGFTSVAAFVREQMRDDARSMVIAWPAAMNNVLPEYCIFPQKEVTSLMLKQKILELDRFRQFVDERRLRFGIVATDAPPNSLFGIRLPDAKLVHEHGGFKVFEFSSR